MSENSKIEWTDHTFNPWWGCIEVSPACDNCYARTWAKFTGHEVWGAAGETPRRLFEDKHWNEPRKWNAVAEQAGERKRVFCASMADVFERYIIEDGTDPLNAQRDRLWALIEETLNLDWLLLTKRPQNIARMVPPTWLATPRPNVWYGATVENQHYADQRLPILLSVPAAARFLSMEPLLGPVEFSDVTKRADAVQQLGKKAMSGIDWVITGGESGAGARPAHPDWYRSLRDQCVTAGVAFHFKQWGNHAPESVANSTKAAKTALYVLPNGSTQPACVGARPAGAVTVQNVGKKAAGRLLDGRTWDEFPTLAVAGAPA